MDETHRLSQIENPDARTNRNSLTARKVLHEELVAEPRAAVVPPDTLYMQEFIRQLKFRGRAVLLAIMFAAIAGHADDPSLSQPVYRSGQFYFDVHGESKAGYVVLSTTNLSDWTPLATYQSVSSDRTLVSPAQNSLAFFKVQRLPLPLFRFALVVKDTIDLNGNNFLSDSFDSSDPSSSANGLYSPNKREIGRAHV